MLATSFLRFKDDTRGLPIFELIKIMKKEAEFMVVAPNDTNTKNEETIDGIKIHRFSYMFPKKLQKLAYGDGIPTNLRTSIIAKIELLLFMVFFFAKSYKISKKCDIIHAQREIPGLIGILIGKLLNKPVVLTVRRAVNSGFIIKRINRYIIENVDHVFFNSAFTKNEFLKFTKPKSFSIVRPTVDTHRFRPDLKKNLKRKYNIDKGDVVLFTLGQLIEKKGIKYLIEAMPFILKKNKKVKLLIGGYGIEEKNLRILVNKIGIRRNIIFIGEIKSNMTPYYYNLADIFILPSIVDISGETETLGVVLLEAMACGKPVIGSNVGGIPDVITPDVGFLVVQKNPTQIAEKVNILINNKDLMKKMGRKALIRVNQNFNGKQIKREILSKYYENLNKI